MAILARIIQFIVWLILATWLGRKLLGWLFGSSTQQRPRPVQSGPTRPLYRDPVCGMFVATEISQTLELDGQIHHFCSAQCREQFERARPNARPGRLRARA